MTGNNEKHDPGPLLALRADSVIWGANHFSDRLPSSGAWVAWDKRDGMASNDGSDGEMAWCSPGGAFGNRMHIFRHMWSGLCRASEKNGLTGASYGAHLHPTQKPIALSSYVFTRAKLKPGDLVFVPYLGSGPDLPAAVAMGLRVIACDVERWCCDTAIGRLGAITPEKAAEPVGPLFGGAARV